MYYDMYVHGVANKYNWYIIASCDFKKKFIPLRVWEDRKTMNQWNLKPTGLTVINTSTICKIELFELYGVTDL